jgi:pleckstrin family protein M 2
LHRYSWCAHSDSPYIQKIANSRNAYSDYYSSSSSLSIFDSDVERKFDGQVTVASMALCERGVPEGQEDPMRALRPKIDIELEENKALEAYIVEKECGNIVEDPPTKLEMPKLLNVKSQVSF